MAQDQPPVKGWPERLWRIFNGVYRASPFGALRVAFADPATGDAFGRFRTSEPVTIFDSQQQYDEQPLLWVSKTSGTATLTHQPDESATDLTLGTASGDLYIRQTRAYFRYQPGKSQFILMTFNLGAGQEGTQKLVGYGDDNNGIFLGQDGGGLFVLLRSSVTGSVSDARKVYQSNWNLDKMNSGGSSGETYDPTKAVILVIDLEWLGVGRVRVGLNIGGYTHYIHEFLNSNVNSTTYMTTANLPCRYEIRNTAAVSSAPTLKQICCSVVSEGGREDTLAYPFSVESISRSIPNGAGNAIVIFAARHKTTFKGIENRGEFFPDAYEVLPVGGTVITRVVYNPTFTAGTWGDVNAESFMESSTDIGTNFSGGTNIDTSIVAGGSSKSSSPVFGRADTSLLPFGLDVDGANPVSLALVAYATANNVTASFAFQWDEKR